MSALRRWCHGDTAHQPDRVPVADITDHWPTRPLPGWLMAAFNADAWRIEGGIVSLRIGPSHYTVAAAGEWLVRDGAGVRLERPAPPAVAAADSTAPAPEGDGSGEAAETISGPVDLAEWRRQWAEAMKRRPVVLPPDPPVDEAAIRADERRRVAEQIAAAIEANKAHVSGEFVWVLDACAAIAGAIARQHTGGTDQ